MHLEAFRADLEKKLGAEALHKIESAKIGIAGAGGLGSNCAVNLVRAGFKNFVIVDFDKIDASNLDRQFYFLDQVGRDKVEAIRENLLRVNPGLHIESVKKKIGRKDVRPLFASCDAVAECLDSAESKSMLIEELMKMGKFVVTVSGVGGIGSSDEIRTNRIKDNLVMIGDMKSDICSKPAISPRVNIAAAKQADAILEHAINNFKKRLDKTGIDGILDLLD